MAWYMNIAWWYEYCMIIRRSHDRRSEGLSLRLLARKLNNRQTSSNAASSEHRRRYQETINRMERWWINNWSIYTWQSAVQRQKKIRSTLRLSPPRLIDRWEHVQVISSSNNYQTSHYHVNMIWWYEYDMI